MSKKRDYGRVTVTHIMADGSVRESVRGYSAAYDSLPVPAREILRKLLTQEPEASPGQDRSDDRDDR